MGTYVISDIHGCYDEFMELLDQMRFDPEQDFLYVLGDVIDRGERSMDCLRYIMDTKNVHFLLGNHEKMMLDYFDDPETYGERWHRNGSDATLAQFDLLSENKRDKVLAYLRERPLYKTIEVNGRCYFLSHAGLNATLPFIRQTSDDLTWSREEFYGHKGLDKHITIFGHTPTYYLRESLFSKGNSEKDSHNCSIWFDKQYGDKICIDGGCVYGGALASLRLDDGAVFYVKSSRGYRCKDYFFKPDNIPASFYKIKA